SSPAPQPRTRARHPISCRRRRICSPSSMVQATSRRDKRSTPPACFPPLYKSNKADLRRPIYPNRPRDLPPYRPLRKLHEQQQQPLVRPLLPSLRRLGRRLLRRLVSTISPHHRRPHPPRPLRPRPSQQLHPDLVQRH